MQLTSAVWEETGRKSGNNSNRADGKVEPQRGTGDATMSENIHQYMPFGGGRVHLGGGQNNTHTQTRAEPKTATRVCVYARSLILIRSVIGLRSLVSIHMIASCVHYVPETNHEVNDREWAHESTVLVSPVPTQSYARHDL